MKKNMEARGRSFLRSARGGMADFSLDSRPFLMSPLGAAAAAVDESDMESLLMEVP